MKSQKIIAACCASYGLYLVLTALGAGVATVIHTLDPLGSPGEARWSSALTQQALFLAPLLLGVVLLLGARQFARFVSTLSGFANDEITLPDPTALLRVALACIGIFMLIKSGSLLGQAGCQAFVLRAGDPSLAFQTGRYLPEHSQSIALILQFLGALVLIRQAAAISAWFQRRWER